MAKKRKKSKALKSFAKGVLTSTEMNGAVFAPEDDSDADEFDQAVDQALLDSFAARLQDAINMLWDVYHRRRGPLTRDEVAYIADLMEDCRDV